MNKWLYEFDAKDIIKKDDGSQETVIKKFALLKPNRRLREDGELFYASETSRFAKAGVLPKAAWNTILLNGGGSISDQEREVYGELLLKFRDESLELQSILFKTEDQRSEADKKRMDEITLNLENIKNEIQSFESSQIAIFENTAEAKARNRTILWWLLNLSYKKDGEEYKLFIPGNSFEEKLNFYDDLEINNDEFNLTILRRLTLLVTVWFLGKAETVEDFKYFDDTVIEKTSEKTEAVTEEIKKTESNQPVEVTK